MNTHLRVGGWPALPAFATLALIATLLFGCGAPGSAVVPDRAPTIVVSGCQLVLHPDGAVLRVRLSSDASEACFIDHAALNAVLRHAMVFRENDQYHPALMTNWWAFKLPLPSVDPAELQILPGISLSHELRRAAHEGWYAGSAGDWAHASRPTDFDRCIVTGDVRFRLARDAPGTQRLSSFRVDGPVRYTKTAMGESSHDQ